MTAMFRITLPDGSSREVAPGTTPADIAAAIGPGLLKAALAARVNGEVRLKLYKGQASVVGRRSPDSLYSERHVTFEDDAGAYDQQDAAGFIKLNALRLRLLAQRDRK